jgi:hypothetical protein
MKRFRVLARLTTAALVVAVMAMSAMAASASGPRRFTFADDLHVQYSGALKVPASTRVVDVDGQDTSAATVRALHARGKILVCYISAGSLESYRPDAAQFPRKVVGKVLDGWPQERWLDIRQRSILVPLMNARVAMCKAKGFDAMDFDNVDGYSNDTGFPLKAADQLNYDRALASLAHAAGMQAVLKNTLGLIPRLVTSFDAAVNEQCVQYSECTAYRPFVRMHKPVWVLEYKTSYAKACSVTKTERLHVQRKRVALDAWRQACPAPRG